LFRNFDILIRDEWKHLSLTDIKNYTLDFYRKDPLFNKKHMTWSYVRIILEVTGTYSELFANAKYGRKVNRAIQAIKDVTQLIKKMVDAGIRSQARNYQIY